MVEGKAKPGGDYSIVIGIAGAMALGVFLWKGGEPAVEAPTAPQIVPATAAQKQACTGLMGQIGKAGVIQDRPSARRIDVNEAVWARLPFKVKQGVLACLAIEAYGTTDPPGLESTVAYGFHTGKRIDQWGGN